MIGRKLLAAAGVAAALLAGCHDTAPSSPAPTPTATLEAVIAEAEALAEKIAERSAAAARSSGQYCRNSIGECVSNIFGGDCPPSHPHQSEDACPTPTAGPAGTATPTPAATPMPTTPAPGATATPLGGWTYAVIGRPLDAHYAQGPSAACAGTWASEQHGDCYLAFDWGWFPYPDPEGTGFEEIGLVRYPAGEPARYERIERGATAREGRGTHECPYPSLLFDRSRLWVSYARTTYDSLGCDGCRIRGSLANWDGQRWSLWPDWLGPLRPEATYRCCDKPAASPLAPRALAVEVRGHGRTMKPPLLTTWDSARGIADLAVSSREPGTWSGNVGWSSAMFSDAGSTYLVAYDSSVPGGPWVLYYVEPDWSGVRLISPMTLPSEVVWVDDCGWGPTPGRLLCLVSTAYGAYGNQTKVSEVESLDFGRTWKLTGRTWSAPGGLRVFEPGYLRRLEDGGVWQDVVLLTVGNGGNAPNAEGDWKLAVMYRPGTSAPVARFLEMLPGWSR